MPLKLKLKANQAPVISIIGDIDRDYFSDVDFAALIATMADSNVIHIEINSWGGDPRIGERIVQMMDMSNATFHAHILDVCASTATMIASKCDTVEMYSGGVYGIHEGSALPDFYLRADELRDVADYVDKYNDLLLEMYKKKTGKDDETIRAWMKEELLMNADEALANGFVDEIVQQGITDRQITLAAKIFGFDETPDAGSVTNPPQTKEENNMSLDVWAKIKAKLGFPQDDLEAFGAATELHERAGRVEKLESDIKDLRANLDKAESEKTRLQAKLQGFEAEQSDTFEQQVTATLDEAIADFRISASMREAWEAKLKADFEGTKALLPEKGAANPGKVSFSASQGKGKGRAYPEINSTIAAHLGVK